MSSPHYELADLVVAKINAGSLGVTARRTYLPRFDRATVDTMQCVVVPVEDDTTIVNRKPSLRGDIQIDVCVLKGLSQGTTDSFDQSELDANCDTVKAIKDHLTLQANLKLGNYCLFRLKNSPLVDREQMERNRQFVSLVTLTYAYVT